MDLKSYIFTGKKESCSGCGACVQVCTKSALSMQPDEEGFLYPVMDKNKCIHCGLCDKRCPEVCDNSNKVISQHCYIATTKEKKYYKESASIGICTMLSNYVLNHGGVVFGCYLDEKIWSAYHIAIKDVKDINLIRNSKYIQSDTKQTYSEVKDFLKSSRLVLYIGTPCQIAGLKSFLHKDYENLYTIDLICHGVFSPKLMPLEIGYWETLFKTKLKNFRFRSKKIYKQTNGGMVNFDLEKKGKLIHIERFAASSPSYHCFAYSGDGLNHNLRLSCYYCPFKSPNRYGDITIGDPWFIKENIIKDFRLRSNNTVRSLYSTNTLKGQYLIDKIVDLLYQNEYPFDDVFVQPAVKYKNRKIPYQRKIIYGNIENEEYGKLIERIFNCNLENEHKSFVRQYIVGLIKKNIKQLIFYNKWKR